MNPIAKRFLENCFHDVWILSSVENMDRYYSKAVTGIFNGKSVTRKDIEAQCKWGKDNEKISHIEFPEVISENNKIAFRVQFHFTDETGKQKSAENMMIYHLDNEGKIHEIWKNSIE